MSTRCGEHRLRITHYMEYRIQWTVLSLTALAAIEIICSRQFEL